MSSIAYRHADVDGFKVFYRERMIRSSCRQAPRHSDATYRAR